MLNPINAVGSPTALKGAEVLSKLEKIIQKFDSECKAQQGALLLKSSSDL